MRAPRSLVTRYGAPGASATRWTARPTASPRRSTGSATLLEPVDDRHADVVVDTTDLNVHELQDRLLGRSARGDGSGMQTAVVSFGYKHGLPLDVDLVIDCRFLPNPHWVEELRPLTGLDDPVRDYVLGSPQTRAVPRPPRRPARLLLPAYVAEGKSYLTVAFGCTGGRHRSVAIAEESRGPASRRLGVRGPP